MVAVVLWDVNIYTDFHCLVALDSQFLSSAVVGELLLRIAGVCTVAAAAAY